jgi:glycosyltransferase involved in cell wall biosynthesis
MLEPAARAHRGLRKHVAWTLIESRVVSGAGLLHATSEIERDTLLALGGAAPVIVIPNGTQIEPPSQRNTDPMHVVFLGRVHPIKRLDLLIDAFAAARERRSALRLTIAGPDESGLHGILSARAGRHADAITWTGAVDDVGRRTLLGTAAALVMCSDSESFGMSVLEAMSAAVPVIVTRTCPWADVQRHNAGFWVEQTLSALADAMIRIADHPDEARMMGERGRALAEARYEWSAVASAFVSQYRALMAMPSAVPVLSASS